MRYNKAKRERNLAPVMDTGKMLYQGIQHLQNLIRIRDEHGKFSTRVFI
jgi:hypothetical protein